MGTFHHSTFLLFTSNYSMRNKPKSESESTVIRFYRKHGNCRVFTLNMFIFSFMSGVGNSRPRVPVSRRFQLCPSSSSCKDYWRLANNCMVHYCHHWYGVWTGITLKKKRKEKKTYFISFQTIFLLSKTETKPDNFYSPTPYSFSNNLIRSNCMLMLLRLWTSCLLSTLYFRHCKITCSKVSSSPQ